MPPLIGLTTSRSVSAYGLPMLGVVEAYVKSLSAAGAVPLLIPLGLSESHLDAMVARLDGILFTGGGDVHPERYRAKGHPKVNSIDEDRDRIEIHLVQQAVQRGTPFLGICRGLQVINVALGGTLYEDIIDQNKGAIRHQFSSDHPRDYLAHSVQVHRGSRLAARHLAGGRNPEVMEKAIRKFSQKDLETMQKMAVFAEPAKGAELLRSIYWTPPPPSHISLPVEELPWAKVFRKHQHPLYEDSWNYMSTMELLDTLFDNEQMKVSSAMATWYNGPHPNWKGTAIEDSIHSLAAKGVRASALRRTTTASSPDFSCTNSPGG